MTKFFTFFNGKGGVGKTTLTILFASYLAYVLNLKVKVIDLEYGDYRIKQFRKTDIQQLELTGTPLNDYAHRNTMPDATTYYSIEERGLSLANQNPQAINHYVDEFAKEKGSSTNDVILLDFPARLTEDEPIMEMAKRQLLDGVYVPMKTEVQERRAACRTAMALGNNGFPVKMLWNNVDTELIRSSMPLDNAERNLNFLSEEFGVHFADARIKCFKKATQGIEKRFFVRTTVCFPEKYVRMWCPEIISLFGDIAKTIQI